MTEVMFQYEHAHCLFPPIDFTFLSRVLIYWRIHMSKAVSRLFAAGFTVFLLFTTATLFARGEQELAFDDPLTLRQQKVVAIAAHAAAGDMDNLVRVLNEGLDAGLTVNETGEVLLQLYAYAGFPRSLNGMGALSAVLKERQEKGLTDSFGVEPDFLPSDTDRYGLGVENLGILMGFPFQQQKAGTNGYNAAMDAFLKEHLFADIFGRDNLSFTMRELATVGVLASLEGTNSQQLFHMNAAMNTGVSEGQMLHLVELIRSERGTEQGDNAAVVLEQVLARRNGAASGPRPESGGYTYIPEIFPRGRLSDNAQIFTGDAWVGPLVPFEGAGDVPIVNVTFAPNTRTTWHAHSYIQILLPTLGHGYYQEEGGEPRKLKAGNSVVIQPGVTHWHGSAPGEWFAHITVIIPVDSGEEDRWLDPVDNEYFQSID